MSTLLRSRWPRVGTSLDNRFRGEWLERGSPSSSGYRRRRGAGTPQTIWYILRPLVAPALATVAIFTFQATWNDFLGPLIYLHDQAYYTIILGLNFFRATYNVNRAYLMAASLTTMLPTVLIFFLARRFFIEGITLAGMKS